MTGEARLTAHGRACVGDLDLGVDVRAAAGEVVALVGPNGAGKSSTLAALLGWLPLAGEVTVDGRAVGDLPPHRRGLGWCPQRAGLPATTRVTTLLRRAAAGDGTRAAAMRDALLLGDAPQRASACSGGQAQRVAVARALLASPVALLDEPLAAQDAAGAAAVRAAVAHHAATGGAVLLVAHRPDDLDGLADRVVVLEAGVVAQDDTLDAVRAAPATAHAARVLGTTVLSGEVGADHVLRGPWGALRVGDGARPGPATALVRPAAVALSSHEPSGGSQRNVLPVEVVAVARHPDGVTVTLDGTPPLRALITDAATEALGLRPGVRLWASIKAADVTLA